MKVSHILQQKGKEVYSVMEERSLVEAVSLLMRHGVGALIVLDKDRKIRGIISERDILRHLDNTGGFLGKQSVQELMTPKEKLIVATEDDDLDYVMGIITKNRIRHLPIVQEGELQGIISIGDVIKCQLSDKQHENKMLQDYIVGRYPA